MRTFQRFNGETGHVCPICGTPHDEEVVLVPIAGTTNDGISEAVQVHTRCLTANWIYQPYMGWIGCMTHHRHKPLTHYYDNLHSTMQRKEH